MEHVVRRSCLRCVFVLWYTVEGTATQNHSSDKQRRLRPAHGGKLELCVGAVSIRVAIVHHHMPLLQGSNCMQKVSGLFLLLIARGLLW